MAAFTGARIHASGRPPIMSACPRGNWQCNAQDTPTMRENRDPRRSDKHRQALAHFTR